MSLRDTIEGARDEAKSTVDAMTKKTAVAEEKDKAKEGDAPAAYDPFKSGKATAAGAKPSREAAASVRMEGERPKKSVALMTKEEKKAARAEERSIEDARNQAYDYLLRLDDAYTKTDKTWWVLLGIGFVMTICSLFLTFVFPAEVKEIHTVQGVLSIVTLILAYGFIISAFIFDWRKRRPFRKAAEKRMQKMSDKRVYEFLAEENAKLVATAKENRKKAKKAQKSK